MSKVTYTFAFGEAEIFTDFWEAVDDDYRNGHYCAQILMDAVGETAVTYEDYLRLKRYCVEQNGWYEHDDNVRPIVFTRRKPNKETPK